jgi:hypothetical protein
MLVLGSIGFAVPWLLAGLAALPVLWLLLRAVPPAPIRRRFPGVVLLLGLEDEDHEADRTPWWLLLLRMLATALLIAGFAGPVLNPRVEQAGNGPLLILTDGSWADARDWAGRGKRIEAALAEASRTGRTVALVSLTDIPPEMPAWRSAGDVRSNLPALQPRPWEPAETDLLRLVAQLPDERFDTLWLSDGLERAGRAELAQALAGHGAVRAVESPRDVLALGEVGYGSGQARIDVMRARGASQHSAEIAVRGLDPSGVERELGRTTAEFADGEIRVAAVFDLPAELRNRITRFEIAGETTAGAVRLTDDALRRRKVALVTAGTGREGLLLLAPDHYLRQALSPTVDLIDGTIADVLLADPDVIVLADLARVAETEALTAWMEKGGLLIRFAGPRLAASDVGRDELDPLLPVRLRSGGRSVGGTMSWGAPKSLAPFPETSPFFGLPVPSEVSVSAQILAQPGPDLAPATIAELADGTPLVTRRAIGDGQVVLFHVSANAEWSSLALSGLFVEMLDRLAVTGGAERPDAEALAGTTWVAEKVLDGFGTLGTADDLAGVAGADLADPVVGPAIPPGLYGSDGRHLAVNVIGEGRDLMAARWAPDIAVEGMATLRETLLGGWVLGASLVLYLVDALATLAIGGRLRGRRMSATASFLLALVLTTSALAPGVARAAGEDDALIRAAGNVVLAYVKSGDAEVDRISEAGMWGLSEALFARTSVEPVEPRGIDLETDDLAVYTFLYWPVTPNQPAPSPQAYSRLNRYLRTGGMILFDTRDGDLAGFGAASPEGRRLQALAAPLDIPPLEPVPRDHVLTRSFYLVQDFPGRYSGAPVWVEAAPADAEQAEGMPFRNLNDNVTPIVIGGNDWASAWAVDEAGRYLFPVGRGLGGERQREIAYRFGVNLIMHVLTGNYKSDQVHVPALLERLGQ